MDSQENILETGKNEEKVIQEATTAVPQEEVLAEAVPEVLTVEEATEAPVREKKAPQLKARKEYTGPKVEGEDFDD